MQKTKFNLAPGLLFALFIASSMPAFADNFQSNEKCNGIKLQMSMPESEIEQHCNVTKLRNDEQITSGQSATKVKTDDPFADRDPSIANLSQIRFITDDGLQHICCYRNNILIKCSGKKPAAAQSN